jgi:fatty-acyl-CoA synthase
MWLELIAHYRGTVTAAPNFAYALAARVLPRAESLDLSSLRFALNGAEPIDIAAVTAFLGAGAPFGLRETVMVPAYGMAESTLGVAFHPWGTPLAIDTIDAVQLEEHRRAVPVVGDAHDAAGSAGGAAPVRRFPRLGPPLPGIDVIARDSDGNDCGEREVGTLMIRGESVTERYLTIDGPVSTRGVDGWLDSGDLGYVTDGAVVVCGRSKDVIIMGGRNIDPTDIERVAQTVIGVRAGNAAAVRLDAGERREGFAVVVESKLARDEAENARIATEVRAAVTAQMGVRPTTVLVVSPGTLPKTPSGKIKRAAAIVLLAS